ncbi:ariadne-like ring finger protein [Thraustotheca clavata]|uniref:Ariadne-like ring finger protein n=1 Tax=Thraustotheca clavata TaxID=74557 RepID=A0A1V9ZPZ3_9STRA|nr:ariadne-like ring finger protein [Thraustotheca clavata]
MALLCCLSDNTLLKSRAEAFLESIRGKWLPLENIVEFPELLSLEFIKLLYRGRAYLSTKEADIYSRLYQLFRMRLAASKGIELSLGYIPNKDELRPDYKTKCLSCGYQTSLSLMATPTQCALCVSYEIEEAKTIQQNHVIDDDRSHLVECRGCHGIYAVIQQELLNITPKCHYCRTLAPEHPELFECRGCLNKFVDPSGLYSKQCGDRCAVCVTTPEKSTTVKSLSFEDIITSNPHAAIAFGWTQESTLDKFIAMVFNRQLNYFKMYTQSHNIVVTTGTESMNGLVFIIDGKVVHGTDALCKEISRILLRDSLKDVCNLCFEEMTLPALESACGRCSTRVCSPCLTRWYGENQPGKLVLTANLSCAFCRRDPKLKVLRKFNRLACGLIFKNGKPEIRPDITASMGEYVLSLTSTLRQIFALTKLLYHGRLKVHIVSYKDYCDGDEVISYCSQRTHSNHDIIQFVSHLRPSGGGDFPEAVKTALNYVLASIHEIKLKNIHAKSLVLVYTDAPPHHIATSSRYQGQEMKAIYANPLYTAGHDWFGIQKACAEADVPVYTFHSHLHNEQSTILSAGFYALLGPVVVLDEITTTNITKATIGLLLQLMGQPFDFNHLFTIKQILLKDKILDRTFTLSLETELPDLFTLKAVNTEFKFPQLDFMQQDLTHLPNLFREDEGFQKMVYNVFGALFTPTTVLSLTYNPILGKLWRLCCSRRLDPRLKSLSTKLSLCTPALSGDDKQQILDWIEESHNELDRIQDSIKEASCADGCLVLESGIDYDISIDDFRSLTRAPRPGVIRNVQSILIHVQFSATTPTINEDGFSEYLPLGLSDRDLFTFLPHLVFPGMSFTLRGAVILAILCALSEHSLLKNRAANFLYAVKGTWLPLENVVSIPEIVSLEFIKLMHRSREYLTEEECRVYDQLHTIYRLRLAAPKELDVAVGYCPVKDSLSHDRKAKCHSCGHFVSYSLMVSPTQCALCVVDGVAGAIHFHRTSALPPTMSHLVECVSCHGLYAVIQVKDLNIPPKCHFCRHFTPVSIIPVVTCVGCQNKLIDPAGLYREMDQVLCAVCENTPQQNKSQLTTELQRLLHTNPTLSSAVGWSKPKKSSQYLSVVFTKELNYFKLFTRCHTLLFGIPRKRSSIDLTHDTLLLEGKTIHNPDQVRDEIKRIIRHSRLVDVCSLCYEELPLISLEKACGRCPTKVCSNCLNEWYGVTEPGKMILTSNLACPFCRQDPMLSVLQKYNRQACTLTQLHKNNWRHDMYYGWCIGCYEIKPMVERACAREVPRDVVDFSCEDCTRAQQEIERAIIEEAIARLNRKEAVDLPKDIMYIIEERVKSTTHLTIKNMEPQCEAEPTWIELAGDKKEIDLFLVCDTTGSMGTYLPALKATLRQVFALTKLLYHGRLFIHIVSYKDYCDGNNFLTSCNRRLERNDGIVRFVDELVPSGGGDWPESIKTALNHVVLTADQIRQTTIDSHALVFLYADAPPHHISTESNNQKKEIAAINGNSKYRAGHDWFKIQKTLQESKISVYTFHSNVDSRQYDDLSMSFYSLLGPVIPVKSLTSSNITKATIGVLQEIMGEPFEFANEYCIATFTHDEKPYDTTYHLEHENDIPAINSITRINEPFQLPTLEYMKEDLEALLPLFGRDEDFRNLVMKTFEVIFRPENVLAVTYNPIFAKLWRLCCRQRLDPRLDDLTNKLSQCIPELASEHKSIVQTWLEESYNDSPRIHESIKAAPEGPCYILDLPDDEMSAKDLRSLARGPNPGVLGRVQSLLTHIQLVEKSDRVASDGTPMYLPQGLKNEDLFAFLPHLVCPGTSFNRRGSAILAHLCCLSDHALLATRAREYLSSISGTWLPFEYVIEFPEIVSVEFIQLMYRGLDLLTPKERNVYKQLFRIHRLRLAATKDIDVHVGFVPKKSGLWPDRKAQCDTCGYKTSYSLMVSPSKCAMCVTYEDDAKRLQENTAIEGNQSHMVECVDCHGVYAVLQVNQLSTLPKCWACRLNIPERPPTVDCHRCLNTFIDPAQLYRQNNSDSNGLWTCPVCVEEPARAIEKKLVQFKAIMGENSSLMNAFGWTTSANTKAFTTMVLNRQLPLIKIVHQSFDLLTSYTDTPTTEVDLRVIGKIVHDAVTLRDELSAMVLQDSLKDVCNLCFEELFLVNLKSACGRCTTKVCSPCLTKWYGENQPGKMVLTTNLACPFCRRDPRLGVLRRHNRQACGLIFTRNRPTYNPEMYYGWCLGCYQIKEMVERACAEEPPRNITDFHCTECLNARAERVDTTLYEGTGAVGKTHECPGCGVLTEKVSGCNHITCVCGQHWCFACGEGFDSDELVYDHMYAVHRGIDEE